MGAARTNRSRQAWFPAQEVGFFSLPPPQKKKPRAGVPFRKAVPKEDSSQNVFFSVWGGLRGPLPDCTSCVASGARQGSLREATGKGGAAEKSVLLDPVAQWRPFCDFFLGRVSL